MSRTFSRALFGFLEGVSLPASLQKLEFGETMASSAASGLGQQNLVEVARESTDEEVLAVTSKKERPLNSSWH